MGIFVLLLIFFDRNSVIERASLKQKIRELEQQKAYYQERIAEDSTIIERLKDDDFLEEFARGKYLMKKDGDVVYRIEK